MIKRIFHFRFDKVFQNFNVHHIACFWIDLSRHTDRKVVIVPVKIRVVAFPKNGIIFLKTPIGAVQSMGGIKMCFSTYGDFHWWYLYVRKIFQI